VSEVAWTAWPGFRLVTRTAEAAGQPVELELLAPRDMPTTDDERYLRSAQGGARSVRTLVRRLFLAKLTMMVPPAEASEVLWHGVSDVCDVDPANQAAIRAGDGIPTPRS